jgi:hypothetical protein
MTQSQLKELVKEYFNLTEVKFGEIFDENKAFKIVFEGDELEVGMKVMVVTTEGQEMPAPDGYHKLEGGIVIKTENSIVTEIAKADDMVEETLEGGKIIDKGPQQMAELPTEQFPVEVTKENKTDVADASRALPTTMESEEDSMIKEEIVKAIAEAVAGQMEEMKKEMAAMKSKMEKMAASPAESKTLPKTKMSSENVPSGIVDASRYEMMKKLIAQKLK